MATYVEKSLKVLKRISNNKLLVNQNKKNRIVLPIKDIDCTYKNTNERFLLYGENRN